MAKGAREALEVLECEIEIVEDAELDEGQDTSVSRVTLCLARLGDPSAVLRKLKTDVSSILPTSASLLWSRIDGHSTLGEILASCALSESDALGVLTILIERECVTFSRPR